MHLISHIILLNHILFFIFAYFILIKLICIFNKLLYSPIFFKENSYIPILFYPELLDTMQFDPKGAINTKSALVHILAWH